MAHDVQKGLAVIQQQLKELDGIFSDAIETLNMAAGTERVAKWRVRTAALLTSSLGEKAGQDFARIEPGPSFTNDLVEEFTDLVDTFRSPLNELLKQLTQAGRSPAAGG
ncbi:MAG TPA: hypothetical protein VFS39_14810 [Nitrospira sp.]|nr:hypothetical protein [Nitrospira sp.]